MKKILIVAMAFLAVFAQTTRLKGAEQDGKQDSKRLADNESDNPKRLRERCSSFQVDSIDYEKSSQLALAATGLNVEKMDKILSSSSLITLNPNFGLGFDPDFDFCVSIVEYIVNSIVNHKKMGCDHSSFCFNGCYFLEERYLPVIAKLLQIPTIRLNTQNKNGETIFHISIKNRLIEIFKLLKDCPLVDPSIKDNKQLTGLDYFDRFRFFNAIKENDNQSFEELFSRVGVGIIEEGGVTPLHVAVKAGNAHAVQILLDAGADMHAIDRFGNTPFIGAVYEAGKDRTNLDRAALIQMLIDAELKQATKEHNPSVVSELLTKGRFSFGIDPIRPTDEAVHDALSLAKNPQPFTDDQIVEGRESKYSVGYRRLNAQQKKERNEEVIRLLTKSIEKK